MAQRKLTQQEQPGSPQAATIGMVDPFKAAATPKPVAPDLAKTAVGTVPTAPIEVTKKSEVIVKPEIDEPEIVLEAQVVLSDLISRLTSSVDSVKAQKQTSPEYGDLLKLSAAKLLRECTYKLTDLGVTLEKVKDTVNVARNEQLKLKSAKDHLAEKGAQYRIERDAFMKLRSIPEKEFYDLMKLIADRTAADKGEKSA